MPEIYHLFSSPNRRTIAVMRVVVTVIYVVMAVWLLIAAGLRIALLLTAGSPLDPLPFISGAIAVVALVAIPAANAELRQRR